jgi:hypothetical protein
VRLAELVLRVARQVVPFIEGREDRLAQRRRTLPDALRGHLRLAFSGRQAVGPKRLPELRHRPLIGEPVLPGHVRCLGQAGLVEGGDQSAVLLFLVKE